MIKIQSDLEFMMIFRDVHSFAYEESLKMKINQLILPHTVMLQLVCVSKSQRNTIGKKKHEEFK
jgi:hypothetical protein